MGEEREALLSDNLWCEFMDPSRLLKPDFDVRIHILKSPLYKQRVSIRPPYITVGIPIALIGVATRTERIRKVMECLEYEPTQNIAS